MKHTAYHVIAAHQAALRAERDQQYLAEQVQRSGPGRLISGVGTGIARLGARRIAAPTPASTPVSASPAATTTGIN
jgi:hypothetical protein